MFSLLFRPLSFRDLPSCKNDETAEPLARSCFQEVSSDWASAFAAADTDKIFHLFSLVSEKFLCLRASVSSAKHCGRGNSLSSLLERLLGQSRVVDNRLPLLNVACVSLQCEELIRPGPIICKRCGSQLARAPPLVAFTFRLRLCLKLVMRHSSRLMRCIPLRSMMLSLDGAIRFKGAFRVLRGPPSVGFPVSLSLLSLSCNMREPTLPVLCSRTL